MKMAYCTIVEVSWSNGSFNGSLNCLSIKGFNSGLRTNVLFIFITNKDTNTYMITYIVCTCITLTVNCNDACLDMCKFYTHLSFNYMKGLISLHFV